MNIDFVTCKIALGGDTQHVMVRGDDRPVGWDEVVILQFLHGEESVYDIDYHHSEDILVAAEKGRLQSIYGSGPVGMVYPGARPFIDGTFPGDKDVAMAPKAVRRPAPVAREGQGLSDEEVDAEVEKALAEGPTLNMKHGSRARANVEV